MDANVTAFVAYCDQSIENLEVKKSFTEDLQMCSYTPKLSGLHYIFAMVDGHAVIGSPFEVRARPKVNPSDIRLIGPAVMSKTLKQNQSTFFIVDPTKASIETEEVKIVIKYEEREIQPDIVRNETGTFTVKFVPSLPGLITIQVSDLDSAKVYMS